MRVDADGLATTKALDVAVRSDLQDLVAANRDGFSERAAGPRKHLSVGDDEIDGTVLVLALRADDQAGDQRAGDDQDDDESGEPRRHAASASR